MDRASKFAAAGLALNMACSVYHVICGVLLHSWWFLTTGVYYAILSVIRFAVIRHRGRERSAVRFAGVMLMVLSVSLAGTVILASVKDRGTEYHLIVMLAVAVYAFTKMTVATAKWIRAAKCASAKLMTLRNISFADAFVSILSLQRSMLVSFDGMAAAEIRMMNIGTGSAVCIIVFLLGANLLRGRRS